MLLSQKFNLSDVQGILSTQISDICPQNVAQSDTGILLQRHLTHVNPKVLEKKFPDLVFDKLKLEVDNSGGYTQRIQSLRIVVQGSFSDPGSSSGKVTIGVEDTTLPVKKRETLIKWDKDGVEEAKIGNYNVVDRSMAGVVKVYNQEIDTAVVIGINSLGMKGLANNTHYETDATNSTNFEALSAIQMYELVSDSISRQHNLVNASIEEGTNQDTTSVYAANICLSPTTVFNLMATTRYNEFTDGTVLRVLRKNFPNVLFLQSPKITNDMVIFSNSADSLALRIPVPMEFSPIFNQYFEFSTKAKYRLGGLDILEPSSGLIVTNLAV